MLDFLLAFFGGSQLTGKNTAPTTPHFELQSFVSTESLEDETELNSSLVTRQLGIQEISHDKALLISPDPPVQFLDLPDEILLHIFNEVKILSKKMSPSPSDTLEPVFKKPNFPVMLHFVNQRLFWLTRHAFKAEISTFPPLFLQHKWFQVPCSIVELHVRLNTLGMTELQQVAKHAPGLSHLSFLREKTHYLEPFEVEGHRDLEKLSSLTYLNLKGLTLKDAPATLKLPLLRSLNLRQRKSSEGYGFVSHLTSLEKLDISETDIHSLTDLQNLTHLSRLYLERCPSLQHLEFPETMIHLQDVYLKRTRYLTLHLDPKLKDVKFHGMRPVTQEITLEDDA